MNLTNNYARGSQLWIHKVRMIGQALSVNFKLALMVGALVFGGYVYQNTTSSQWSAAQTFALAEFLVVTTFGDPSHMVQTYQDSKGFNRKARSIDILKSPYFKAHIHHLKQNSIAGIIWGLFATFGIIFGVFCFFLIRENLKLPNTKTGVVVWRTLKRFRNS